MNSTKLPFTAPDVRIHLVQDWPKQAIAPPDRRIPLHQSEKEDKASTRVVGQKLCNFGHQLVGSAGHVLLVEDRQLLLLVNTDSAIKLIVSASTCVTVQQKRQAAPRVSIISVQSISGPHLSSRNVCCMSSKKASVSGSGPRHSSYGSFDITLTMSSATCGDCSATTQSTWSPSLRYFTAPPASSPSTRTSSALRFMCRAGPGR